MHPQRCQNQTRYLLIAFRCDSPAELQKLEQPRQPLPAQWKPAYLRRLCYRRLLSQHPLSNRKSRPQQASYRCRRLASSVIATLYGVGLRGDNIRVQSIVRMRVCRSNVRGNPRSHPRIHSSIKIRDRGRSLHPVWLARAFKFASVSFAVAPDATVSSLVLSEGLRNPPSLP